MSRFYDLDTANALVPEMAVVLERLRDQRAELIELRDTARNLPSSASVPAAEARPEPDPELRRIELRMRGIVDQMQAEVHWLDDRSIALRDIETGLIDFPALVTGRQVWLCWRLGEGDVAWWHELTTGFGGRRPLIELE